MFTTFTNLFKNMFSLVTRVWAKKNKVRANFKLPPSEMGLFVSLYAAGEITHMSIGAWHLRITGVAVRKRTLTVTLEATDDAEAEEIVAAFVAGLIQKMKPSRVQ